MSHGKDNQILFAPSHRMTRQRANDYVAVNKLADKRYLVDTCGQGVFCELLALVG